MKKLFIALLILLISNATIIKADDLRGSVRNKKSEPLEYVHVQLLGTSYKAVTDSTGMFRIKDIPEGDYHVQFSFSFYKTRKVTVKVTSGQTTRIDPVVLEESNQMLDEVVISGNKHTYTTDKVSNSVRLERPLLQIPQNIQVINDQILADRQITSMSDGLVGNVSGVTRLEHWGDSYTRVNMRGSRAAAFREGMNVTSTWGPMTEDMSFVESVEFVKGPAGFMMSNGEPSGIYNVVLKKPTGQTKGQAEFTFGSYDMYRSTLDLDGKLDQDGRLLYRLNLMGQSKNSFRRYEFNKRYSIAPVVSYQLDNDTKLTAMYTFQYMKSSNIGSYYNFSANGYADLPQDYSLLEPGMAPSTAKDHSLILNLQHHFNKDWKLTVQGAYFNYSRIGSSMWYSSLEQNGDMIRYVSIGDEVNEMKFGQAYLNGQFQTGTVSHHILTGIDLGDKHFWGDWSQSHTLDSLGTYNIYNTAYTPGYPYYGYASFDRTRSIKERANTTQVTQSYTGLYLQDELGFFNDRVRLTLAGRYTFVKDNSYGTSVTNVERFTPRVGLSFSIDKNTSAYLLYDQTFSPQMGLLRNGDKVNPITGNNWEAGLKRSWFNDRWHTSVSVYQILKNNETASDPENAAGESYLVQVGQSKAKGVEVDLVGEIVKGLSVIANYAYTDYKVSKSVDPSRPVGMQLPGHAMHDFNIWLKYAFSRGALNGFSLSAGQSSQLDRSTWGGLSDNGDSSLPDYFRFDAAAGWRTGNLAIALNVYNLFNRYLYSGSMYGNVYYWQSEPKRNFKLGITYNF